MKHKECGRRILRYFIETADIRNAILMQLLQKERCEVYEYPLHKEKVKAGDTLVFAASKKFLADEVLNFPNNITIFSGAISDEIADGFSKKQITHINFLENEIFALKNALLTAEGTLSEIMLATGRSLYQNKYLLLGYGRCTKALALLLCKLGIKCDIVSFNKQHFNECCLFADRCYFEYEFLDCLKQYDVIVNSIPSKIFEDKMLKYFKAGACVLEVASINCLSAQLVKDFKYVLLPALPRKYTPQSAAGLMLEVMSDK